MSVEKRPSANTRKTIGNGPYLAKVVGHLDPAFMGTLQVTLLRREGNNIGDANQTYSVKFASPFYGSTAYEFMGQNKEDFNDTQKSYGMWFVPPDVGVTVLTFFVDGDPSQGFWTACVPGKFTNHMVPGIAGSLNVELSAADKAKYDTKQPLPVGEVNRQANALDTNMEIDKIKKPVHPIADVFLEQGLLEDDARGTTTSTSRRNVPNMVFGISTPGPLDRRAGALRKTIGQKQSLTAKPVPVSRLGGTTMVFDDGDDQYQRVKPASAGPVEYVDTLDTNETKKGQPDIPYNEYFRIRTRTGHQLLMHNSEDLIYIGNSRGTTWIEMTSNGKIDIYAQDSVSVHTENDFNFRADRDINMEAGRNINMKAASGKWHVEVAQDLEFLVNGASKITVGNNLELLVGGSSKISTVGTTHINSGANNNISAGGDTNIGSGGDHVESAGKIYMNSMAAEAAENAEQVLPLVLRDNPVTSTKAGWVSSKRYQSGTFASIMKRVPMHEPWVLHENQAPQFVTPLDTDRDEG